MAASISKCATAFTEAWLDDELVLISLTSGEVFSLQGTALEIWKLIDGVRDRSTLAAGLYEQYKIATDTLAGDANAFIDRLSAEGFIQEL